MAKHTLPNLGLTGGYADGADNWGTEQNANLLKLSTLTQGSVIDSVAAVPGSPAQGDAYILTAAPNANAVAVYDEGAWTYFSPQAGWMMYDEAAAQYMSFDGSAWAVFSGSGGGGGGIEDAPADGKAYVRMNNQWVEDVYGGGGGGGGGGDPALAPNIYQHATARQSGGTANAVFPNPVTAGNAVVLLVSGYSATKTFPAGFTKIGEYSISNNHVLCAIKLVDGTEGTTFGVSTSSDWCNVSAYEIDPPQDFFAQGGALTVSAGKWGFSQFGAGALDILGIEIDGIGGMAFVGDIYPDYRDKLGTRTTGNHHALHVAAAQNSFTPIRGTIDNSSTSYVYGLFQFKGGGKVARAPGSGRIPLLRLRIRSTANTGDGYLMFANIAFKKGGAPIGTVGEANARDTYGSNYPENAFNGNLGNWWISNGGDATNCWVSTEINERDAQYPDSVDISSRDATRIPPSFVVEASEDGGSTWTVLWTVADTSGWAANSTRTFNKP